LKSAAVARLALLLSAACSASAAEPSLPGFDIEDYFRLVRFPEVALSADGTRVVYAADRRSLATDQPTRTVYLASTAGGAPVELTALADAHAVCFVPHENAVAGLESVAGTDQVVIEDLSHGGLEQITHARDPILLYVFAPTGARVLAFTTRKPFDERQSLFERVRHGDAGFTVDPDIVEMYDFIDPYWETIFPQHPSGGAYAGGELWLQRPGKSALRLDVPGAVTALHWSPDGEMLSVTYVADDAPASYWRFVETSVGVVDAHTGAFRAIARTDVASTASNWTYYEGGEWLPHSRLLLLRRKTTGTGPAAQYTDWAYARVAEGSSTFIPWTRAEASGERFFPVDAHSVLVEEKSRARIGLHRWTTSGSSVEFLPEEGSASQFAFDADDRRYAFVLESLVLPPEVHFRERASGRDVPLSRLNVGLNEKIHFTRRALHWKGADGVDVSGWLLLPAQAHSGPWPMVTLVHGGPGWAFTDAFAPYFDFGWPYPLEALASSGIAVFIPNYRGTSGFGTAFANPTSLMREPADDVNRGVEYLIAEGIAEPEKLGLIGQSHGGWLGPLIMERFRRFQVASFAEGWSNWIVLYDLNSGSQNITIHDKWMGASMYDAPEAYVTASPDLHMRGVTTATLWEAGGLSDPHFVLPMGKAARRAGAPSEAVLYPRTHHSVVSPRVAHDAADRNLDWFRFWLQDRIDPDPRKAETYARWSSLKAARARTLSQGRSHDSM